MKYMAYLPYPNTLSVHRIAFGMQIVYHKNNKFVSEEAFYVQIHYGARFRNDKQPLHSL